MSLILTTRQVAAKLQLTERTVRLYLRTGKLPGRKLGKSWRVLDSDVESWMIAGRSVRRAPFVSARGFLKRFPGRLSSADVIADKRAEAQLEDSHERRV